MKQPVRNILQYPIIFFYISGILFQLLVIFKIIPFQWVNGGLSPSYEAQALQSVVSVIIMALLFLFVWRVMKSNTQPKRWQYNSLRVITVFWVLGLVMQIIGTPFERYVLSFTLLLGVVSHILLIRQIHTVNVY